MTHSIIKIVSGGQTGVDRAALDLALELDIPCGGWCPKGRRAEDGPIADYYPLQETPTSSYEQRTQWNVRDADGTLVFTLPKVSRGTALTIYFAQKYEKPHLKLNLNENHQLKKFVDWATTHQIKVLNVAGPRESHEPGFVYEESKTYLRELLTELRCTHD